MTYRNRTQDGGAFTTAGRARSVLAACAVMVGCAPPTSIDPRLELRADEASPVRGVVTFDARPLDIEPTRVDFYLGSEDGPPLHSDLEPPFTWTLDTETLPDGEHVVVALAHEGATCARGELPFESRNPPGLLSVTADMPSPVRGVVTFRARPQNVAPTRVDFFLDSPDGPPVHSDERQPFTWTVDTETMAEGDHVVFAVAHAGETSVDDDLAFAVRNQPNIVFVFIDDLDELQSPYLEAMPNTLAEIADRGLRFTRAFAPTPLCDPGRAIALTGRYAHNTGVYDLTPPDGGHEPFRAGPEGDTVATALKTAGYRTAFLGKYLGTDQDAAYVPPGWDEWFSILTNKYVGYDYDVSHNGERVSYGSAPEDYQTDVLSGIAADFIEASELEDDRPFFLMVAPAAPHVPIPPAPRHTDHPWVEADLPWWPSYDELDVSDKVTWLRDGVASFTLGVAVFNVVDYRRRMGALMAIDDMIGALVDVLEATGELENTVFFVSSDNGYNLGAHRLVGKQGPYEESVRIPLLVAGRDVRVGTETRMVNQTDFAPTFLDLAGVPHEDRDGHSLVPLLRGEPAPWRADQVFEYNATWGGQYGVCDTLDDVLAEIEGGNTRVMVPSYRALRTEDVLYVEWYRGAVHEYELFDLTSDPFQLENLLATDEGMQAHAATVATLQARLDALVTCAGEGCR